MADLICETCKTISSPDNEVMLTGDVATCQRCLNRKKQEYDLVATNFFNGIFKTAVCPTCNRPFVVPTMNIYKITKNSRTYHFCKYTCKTKAERENLI